MALEDGAWRWWRRVREFEPPPLALRCRDVPGTCPRFGSSDPNRLDPRSLSILLFLCVFDSLILRLPCRGSLALEDDRTKVLPNVCTYTHAVI